MYVFYSYPHYIVPDNSTISEINIFKNVQACFRREDDFAVFGFCVLLLLFGFLFRGGLKNLSKVFRGTLAYSYGKQREVSGQGHTLHDHSRLKQLQAGVESPRTLQR